MYKIHVFEINEGTGKYFIQYSSKELESCFAEFIRKVREGNVPKIHRELCDNSPEFVDPVEAKRACEWLVYSIEELGGEVIAGTPLQNKYWQVYIIQLGNEPKTIYIGESNYAPEVRFEQHKIGFNSNPKVRNAEFAKLRPDLYLQIEPVRSQTESRVLEAEVAEYYRGRGYKVYGGH